MSVLPNSAYVFIIALKILSIYFGYRLTDSKIYMENQKTQSSQHDTKEDCQRVNTTNSKTHYKAKMMNSALN